MQPRVSVITPSYNCLQYLPAALESVRRQGIADLEMIVVDDGSTDGSGEWLTEQAQRDSRLVVIKMPGQKNGSAAARNAGIQVARAPVLAFLDADDTWYPDAIGDRLALHESDTSIVLSFADYRSVTPEGRDLGTYFSYCRNFHRWIDRREGLLPLGDRALAMIFAEAICGASTVLAARGALMDQGGFDANVIFSQDWECWLRLAQRGTVWCSTRIATEYLVRPGSNSRNRGNVLATNRAIFERYAPSVRAVEPRAIRIARAWLDVIAADVARDQGRRFRAMCLHLQAFARDPSIRVARSAAYDLAKLTGLR